MSELEHISCKAVMEQKDAKGKQCWRPPKENGFCGIHQKHVLIQTQLTQNKRKCLTYRCIHFLEQESDDKYCESCKEQKREVLQTVKLCKALIDQGPTKGAQCSRKAKSSSDYCGKHIERQTLLLEAKQHNLRICDDGKRACKQNTNDGKLLCEDCLKKCREYDNEYHQLRKNAISTTI